MSSIAQQKKSNQNRKKSILFIQKDVCKLVCINFQIYKKMGNW